MFNTLTLVNRDRHNGVAVGRGISANKRYSMIKLLTALTVVTILAAMAAASAIKPKIFFTDGRVNLENPPKRIYIIGNDGITLCREAPATVNEGDIAVASNEELRAAPLSGKRLLALWECSAQCREAAEGWRPQGADRSAVVGDRDPAGAEATIRQEAPIEAGRGDRDAASTRGCNDR